MWDPSEAAQRAREAAARVRSALWRDVPQTHAGLFAATQAVRAVWQAAQLQLPLPQPALQVAAPGYAPPWAAEPPPEDPDVAARERWRREKFRWWLERWRASRSLLPFELWLVLIGALPPGPEAAALARQFGVGEAYEQAVARWRAEEAWRLRRWPGG